MSTTKQHRPEHSPALTNHQIATCLEEVAELLEAQGANVFRVRAYRTAAHNLRDLPRPVQEIVGTEGVAGLIELPGIGHSLARAIERLCLTGGVASAMRGKRIIRGREGECAACYGKEPKRPLPSSLPVDQPGREGSAPDG